MAELVTIDLAFVSCVCEPGVPRDSRCDDGTNRTNNAQSMNWVWRQHAQGNIFGLDFNVYGACPGHHWLLDTIYGRDVLKAYLAKMHPDIAISNWKAQPELNVWLERVIDMLQLRELQEPQTCSEHARYIGRMSRLLMGVGDVKKNCSKR